MAERFVIVKVPAPISTEIRNASEDKKLAEGERMKRCLQSEGVFRVGQKVDMRFRLDPIADPLSPTSKVVVFDPDGDPHGEQYVVETPFSIRRN